MKKVSKFLAVLLSMTLVFGCFVTGFAAGDIDYEISNPYEGVSWGEWNQYKADLHCHTTASDGDADFNEMIETHYEQGFDSLAITDHGTVNYSWTNVNIKNYFKIFMAVKKEGARVATPLTEERFAEITSGVGRGGRGMISVPYGIEQNPTSLNNAHVNSFFCDYGDGLMGGTSNYEEVIKAVEEGGGISVINHPGEYTGAKKENSEQEAYDGSVSYRYYVNKFTDLLVNYESCLGIDVNSKKDGRTKYDRKLWDILLQNVVPTGRNVYGFATSDAHQLNVVGCGWTMLCMPENTQENMLACLKDGAFFACSRFIKNETELAKLSELTGLTLGTVFEQTDYSVPTPGVTWVAVDEAADTITLTTENALGVQWIADGEVIATGGTLSLDSVSDKLGSYVRAEVFGNGGILYTQPFMLEYDGAPQAQDRFFVDFGNILTFLKNAIIKACLLLWPVSAVYNYLVGAAD